MTEPDLSEFRAHDENADLRRQVRDLQARLVQAKAKTAELVEAVYQGARDAAVVLGNPPAVPCPKTDKRRKKPEVALVLLSDWQIGKVTESYNSQVALQRLRLLASKVEQITNIQREDHPVRECHVLLNGDMVEGTAIFPGQAHLVDSSLFEQTFTAASAVEEFVGRMLATFETVHVWEESGNHGRLGRKGDYSVTDNQDLMVYKLARRDLAPHERSSRLVWHESQGWHSIVQIGNYRALLVHGDEIKSFGGQTPAFGIIRKVNAWATGVVEPFTDCLMGHFHQPLALPIAHGKGRVFVNPSLESDNVYAAEFVGASGTPGQRLNFVDPDKGRVSSEHLIWLD